MKKLLTIAFTLLMYTNTSFAFSSSKFDSLCNNFAKIQSIVQLYMDNYTWNSLQILMTPSGPVPVPGVHLSLFRDTSPIAEFCNYYQQLQKLDTVGKVELGGEILNRLTNNKWEHHTDFASDTWTILSQAYDFENGEMRKGVLESESFHRSINSYANDSYYWYNKTFNGEEKELKTRAQRESDMRDFSQAVYERSTLEEALRCPEPKDNTNYGNVYETRIKPKEELSEDYKDEADFYFGKLLELGPYFMRTEEDNIAYSEQVKKLRYSSIYIDTQVKKIQETEKVPSQKYKEKDGSVKFIDKKVTRSYNQFTAKMTGTDFSDFKRRYENDWKTYIVNATVRNGIDGILDNPIEATNEEFIEIDYVCDEYNVRRKHSLDKDSPNYGALIEKKMEDCLIKEKAAAKDYSSILGYYTDKLKVATLKLKKTTAEYMTLQSKLLKRTFVADTGRNKKSGGNRTEQFSCQESKKLSASQMISLQGKLRNNRSKIRKSIAVEKKKLLTIKENQRKQQVEYLRDNARKEQFAQKTAENRQKDEAGSSSFSTPITVSGSSTGNN